MNTESHYSDNYFVDHYGKLVDDDLRYSLLAKHWHSIISESLATESLDNGYWLDFGAGSGVVSAAFAKCDCFDIAEWAQNQLRARGRNVFRDIRDLPDSGFDGIVCSHSLEHHPSPYDSLLTMRRVAKRAAKLVLFLPIERDFSVRMSPDSDQHLYCWNFQTISNLLRQTGWTPLLGKTVYGPFMLTVLGKRLPSSTAVRTAKLFGQLKRNFPSILVTATNESTSQN